MANRVPLTVSKQRLQGMRHTPTIKTGNLNCNALFKTKFTSLSPMGAPKSSMQISHMQKGQKTTVPNSNVTHQQDVFGGVCFSTGTDELNGVFEDPNSGALARARKLQVLNDRKNKLKLINEHYLKSSNNTFKIDGVFKPNDVVMPTAQTDLQQCSELLLNKLQTPMPRILATDVDDETNHTQVSDSDGAKGLSTKGGSAGKGSDTTYSGTPESQIPEAGESKIFKV